MLRPAHSNTRDQPPSADSDIPASATPDSTGSVGGSVGGSGGADGVTLRSLFEAEEASLLRYAWSLTGRRAVAEELVQEIFLQLHAKWGEVQAPRAWLYRCLRNRALNHLRQCKRETLDSDRRQANSQIEGEELMGCTNLTESTAETPDQVMARVEMSVMLRQQLDNLSEDDQQLIRLKYFDDLKYREISQQTGLSIGNVGFRLHKIMQQLASGMRPLGIDETK